MWKAKLNQHFAKIAFLLWNLVFHSLWLSALFFLSNGSNFNSIWAENQLLFSTLSIGLFSFFGREEWINRLRNTHQTQKLFFLGWAQALILITLITFQAIYSGKIEYLGVSSEIGLNFLYSYSWLLRSFLLLILSFALNAATKNIQPHWIGFPLQCFFFWIWFQPNWTDYMILGGIYIFNSNILFSTGLMAGVFTLTHAVLGTPLMGNEFTGLLQFKWPQDESTLLDHPALILGLFLLTFMNKLRKISQNRKTQNRKEQHAS
jgi:hypothetical protein